MLILLHVVIALTSIGAATYLAISPSQHKLYATYGLILTTIASGSYLVWRLHSPMIASCVTGLAYLGVVLIGVTVAHRRLAKAKDKIN